MKHMKRTRKLISFCLALIVVFASLSACDTNQMGGMLSETKSLPLFIDDSVSDDSVSAIKNPVIPEWASDYQSILDGYREFADYIINNVIIDHFVDHFDEDIFCPPDMDADMRYRWVCMMIETNIWYYRDFPKTREAFGYALKDLNGDGIPELILLLQDYTVLAAFSTVNETPRLLDVFWSRHRCAIFDSGLLYIDGNSGAVYWMRSMQQVSQGGNGLVTIEQYGMDDDAYYRIVDGVQIGISKAELEEYFERLPALSSKTANEITRNSGIQYIPLFA